MRGTLTLLLEEPQSLLVKDLLTYTSFSAMKPNVPEPTPTDMLCRS